MSNAILDAERVLDTAWTAAVAVFLRNAPEPDTWTIVETPDGFSIVIGDKSLRMLSIMEASLVQGGLTLAYYALYADDETN